MYVLTVTETLEAWEDSVNIGTAPLHLLQHTVFFSREGQYNACMDAIWAVGIAVTTGAYKSRPLTVAAVVLNTVYHSCQ